MKNRKVEITELLAKYDAGVALSHYKLVNSFEALLEEAFAEGYSFAKEEAKLVIEAAEVLGK